MPVSPCAVVLCKCTVLVLVSCQSRLRSVIIITAETVGMPTFGKDLASLFVAVAMRCWEIMAGEKHATTARAKQTKASLRRETWKAMEESVPQIGLLAIVDFFFCEIRGFTTPDGHAQLESAITRSRTWRTRGLSTFDSNDFFRECRQAILRDCAAACSAPHCTARLVCAMRDA